MIKSAIYTMILMLTAQPSFSQDKKPNIETKTEANEKILNICYENWQPFIFSEKVNKNMIEKGIAVEIIETALKRMGYKAKWKLMAAKRCYAEVETGHFQMTMNVSHLENMKWLESKTTIVDWELAAIIQKSDPIEKYESMDQFKGKTVGMTRGYVYPDEIAKELKKFKIDEVADPEKNLQKLSLGRIGLLIEDPVWAATIAKRDNLAIKQLAPSIAIDPTYVTFTPKLKNLLEEYDNHIIDMANEGVIDKVYMKTIGKPYRGTAAIKALKKSK